MKKTLLIVLFSLTTVAAFSQMNGDYNYSIAVRGYTMMQMPKLLNESGSEKFTNAVLNGIMVKFNDNQINFRLSGNYYNRSKKFNNNCETCQEADGKLTDYSFKLGFEKNFNYSRIQPYFAFDLGYRFNKFNGNLVNINSTVEGSQSQEVEASKSGLVISPVLGFKVNPIKEISLFAEASLDFFYSYERQVTFIKEGNNDQLLRKYYKTEFLPNPISVGIQIHLGSNK